MSAIGDLFKKAHNVINGIRGYNSLMLGKDGDIVFSKNNVCVHEATGRTGEDEAHCAGYLTVHCQRDATIGATLILQWLPNVTLHKNPASIRSVSPRSHNVREKEEMKDVAFEGNILNKCNEIAAAAAIQVSDDESSSSVDIRVEECGTATIVKQVIRPTTLLPTTIGKTADSGLGVPSINVIPNTPIATEGNSVLKKSEDGLSQSSLSTSCADEMSEEEHSSDDELEEKKKNGNHTDNVPSALDKFIGSALGFDKTPEQFAIEHDLMLGNGAPDERYRPRSNSNNTSLFSVNLGKMRSMRLFYSNAECTCGQLVIASPDSHYKILHFHHGGLDKLAQIFEQWSMIKTRSVKNGSPSAVVDRHFIVCQPAVNKHEMDPQEGLYDKISIHSWKSYENRVGVIDDSATVRKHIFFASMEPDMRKIIWPFLLRVYPWQSTLEQRETIKNDLFLEYQKIRKRRYKCAESGQNRWTSIENSIEKDVVRTDRRNPFFSGDNNPNMEIMKNILLNYATMYPEVNYIQGMSDLLAPLLYTLKDEVDAYWCFQSFMQQTVFSSTPLGNENMMEINLGYLRSLLELETPDFYAHLKKQKSDAMQLMFVHRWILLCFKREFSEEHALHIWECCWAQYRTHFFHLFVCASIVSIYGGDVIAQDLPHDEILLFFASLAHHMEARVVLQKARGLLHDFIRRESIPCSLVGLCSAELEQWDSHKSSQSYFCNQQDVHQDDCPFQ